MVTLSFTALQVNPTTSADEKPGNVKEVHKRVRSHLSDLLQLLIVFQEEGQIHEGHVHVWIPAERPVLLHGVLPAGEGVFIDLEQEELESISPSLVVNT